ncbi:MAG: hypothetical protein VB086_04760 [Clostridiaceae bacterium]|nr:hypothetical protein [Clostridiaceae bacterium]
MTITVIGKAHLEGTSRKSGKPYNLNQVHFNNKQRGVEGLAAQAIMIDPSIAPFDGIAVGAKYVVDFDQHGYVTAFEPAK